MSFWDAQARWQKLWLTHCDYHQNIIPFVSRNVAPGWRVLDIGAGSGALALPLRQLGCDVTALEPSRGMRELLRQAAGGRQRPHLRIDRRSWEEVPISQARGFNLILACNSLHLTAAGVSGALARIFQAGPRHVCVISETGLSEAVARRHPDSYRLTWQTHLQTDSSMAYYSLTEAWEHFRHGWGRPPTPEEKAAIQAELIYRNHLYWLPQEVRLTMCWWSRVAARKGAWAAAQHLDNRPDW